jgi:Raf kinase inhibitor-like YbhB/YbcL family protein
METSRLTMLSKDLFDVPSTIQVTSDAFENGGQMPDWTSEYSEHISPPLHWSGIPQSTKAVVLMMEDPEAHRLEPYEHWTMILPAEIDDLPRGIHLGGVCQEVPRAIQGVNGRGLSGYMGPKPPPGDKAHHYHFQVLALDVWPNPEPGWNRGDLIEHIEGHVIAKGDLVGVYQVPM